MIAGGRFSEIRRILTESEPTEEIPPAPISLAETEIKTIGGEPHLFWNAHKAVREKGSAEDLQEFVEKVDFSLFDYLKPKEYHDFNNWEREQFLDVSDLICQVPPSAIALLRAVDYIIEAGIDGDFVECGVFKAASAILMARALLHQNVMDRDIYMYDTFEGMPKPTEWDVDYTGARSMDVWEKTKWDHVDGSSDVYSPIEEVQENLKRVPYPEERFHLIKGKVEDTIPAVAPERIALLRLDTDYYESTKHELEHLFPRLQKGGVLVIDDYGHFQGARKAVDEYFQASERKSVFLVRVTESVRFAVKVF